MGPEVPIGCPWGDFPSLAVVVASELARRLWVCCRLSCRRCCLCRREVGLWVSHTPRSPPHPHPVERNRSCVAVYSARTSRWQNKGGVREIGAMCTEANKMRTEQGSISRCCGYTSGHGCKAHQKPPGFCLQYLQPARCHLQVANQRAYECMLESGHLVHARMANVELYREAAGTYGVGGWLTWRVAARP